ncbi:TWiK family of potassium channels protein 7-like [Branchiostoma lanceolatum]|uniref:TWiK family of potassium channels protein 7-like n=1 Tax=Branchiostoma lanceolatum TaxID=7740 RepID=UPI003452254B
MTTLEVQQVDRSRGGQLNRPAIRDKRSTPSNNDGGHDPTLPAVDRKKDSESVIQPDERRTRVMRTRKNISWTKRNVRVVWSHVKWTLINIGYLGFGAMMFAALEVPPADVSYRAHRQVLLDALGMNASNSSDFEEWEKAVSVEFLRHQDIVLNARLAMVYGTNTTNSRYLAEPARAFFLAFVVVTTIGYGHSTPRTPGGRVFLIFYAMFGIPLMMTWVSDVGAKLDSLLRYLVGKMSRCRSKKESEVDSVPSWVTIFLLAAFLLLDAAGLSAFENWDLLDSIYYSYITVTSIGFGDFVPSNQLNVVLALPHLMVGLALASMLNGLTGQTIMWLSANFAQWARVMVGKPCPCCGLTNAKALRPEDIVMVRRLALRWRRRCRESAVRQRRTRAQLLPVTVVWDDISDPHAPQD